MNTGSAVAAGALPTSAELGAMPEPAFRAHVRQWLGDNLPAGMVRRSRTAVHPSREDMLGVSAVLAHRGWSVPNWPLVHGGTGWSALRCQVFDEELVLAGASPNNIQGVSLAGPVIAAFGTAAQQARFLPGIREGREFWAQGFSEPEAGSDLASLRTRAVLRDGHWIVEGQKLWTSQAMFADMIFCLVRTDPAARPQLGISFLLIPMTLPGITVRPIRSIDEGESLCEVFFDAVRVPADALVGEAGRGWDCAKYLLARERVQTAEVPRNTFYLSRLRSIATTERRADRALIDDPVFAADLGRVEIDLIGLEAAVTRALASEDMSALTPSALKVLGCELMQRQLALQVQALGARAQLFHPPEMPEVHGPAAEHGAGVVAEFLFRRAATIYGGSTEIQKNIMARLLLQGEEIPGLARGCAAFATGQAPRAGDLTAAELESLADSAGRHARTAFAPTLAGASPEAQRAAWRELAAQGCLGLHIPEALGGAGGGPEALAAVCEAYGAALLPLPFIALATLPGQLLARLPIAPAARAARLGPVLGGERLVAVAGVDPAQTTPTAHGEGEITTLRAGQPLVVAGGGIATHLLIATADAGSGAPGLWLLEADSLGARLRRSRGIDGRDLALVDLDGLRLPRGARVTATPDGLATAFAAARDHALVMSCAEMVGAMREALRITRDHLRTRRQFGSPLAEFQALRHRLAEMHAEILVASAITARATAALADDACPGRLVAAARARCARATTFVANQSVQLHGGIGMTDASRIGALYKRLFTLEATMGNTRLHECRFAAAR